MKVKALKAEFVVNKAYELKMQEPVQTAKKVGAYAVDIFNFFGIQVSDSIKNIYRLDELDNELSYLYRMNK